MPSWSIHLLVARRVCDKLKLEKDSFYFGNLIPDVDCNSRINRKQTHYYDTNLYFDFCNRARKIDIDRFLKDYKESIKNPLILGYYSHLLCDNFYNEYFYSKKWVIDKDKNPIGIRLKDNKIVDIGIDDPDRLKQKYKHDDLELYGKFIYKDKLIVIPKDTKKIKKDIIYLKDRFMTDDMVERRIDYLNNGFELFNKLDTDNRDDYKTFYKEELDTLLESCIDYVEEKLEEVITNG